MSNTRCMFMSALLPPNLSMALIPKWMSALIETNFKTFCSEDFAKIFDSTVQLFKWPLNSSLDFLGAYYLSSHLLNLSLSTRLSVFQIHISSATLTYSDKYPKEPTAKSYSKLIQSSLGFKKEHSDYNFWGEFQNKMYKKNSLISPRI